MIYYDIRQKTNLDAASIEKSEPKQVRVFYYDNDNIQEQEVILDYVKLIDITDKNERIVKLGYITDIEKVKVPIYITTTLNGDYMEVYPGKNGIYEFQKEEILDDTTGKMKDTNAYIKSVKAPKGIRYKIDYVTEHGVS